MNREERGNKGCEREWGRERERVGRARGNQEVKGYGGGGGGVAYLIVDLYVGLKKTNPDAKAVYLKVSKK